MGDGDTVGLRLTSEGIVIERVDVIALHTAGEGLAATLGADEPTLFAAAAWAACVADPALFTDPLPPLSEIVEDYGLAHRGEWLAPSGFDFSRWRFERRCEFLAERHGLDLDDALVLASLVGLFDQVARVLIEAGDADEAVATDGGPEIRSADGFFGAVGELGGQLADPLLAELAHDLLRAVPFPRRHDLVEPSCPQRGPQDSHTSSANMKPSGSMNPSPHSTVTRRGRQLTIPLGAAT